MAQIDTTKSVLITGASTGIGRATAIYLSRHGFEVFAGARKPDDIKSLHSLDNVTGIAIDVTKQETIDAAAKIMSQQLGDRGLDGIVNNAGIVVASPLEFVPVRQLRWQFEVNVIGQIAVTQAMMPLLRLNKGRIVFMGSSSGRFAAPFMGAYCGSKFAIEGLADSLRRELLPFGMQVVIIEPGAIETPIWDKSRKDADQLLADLPEEGKHYYGDMIPLVLQAAEKTAASAIPAEKVAEAVLHALVAKRPRVRYPVGLDARIQNYMERLLPTRLVDRLVSRFMGLGL